MALPARSQARMPDAQARAAGRVASPVASRLGRWLLARWRQAVRARAVPAELRAQLALSRGEVVLAVGLGQDGTHAVIATDRRLCLRSVTGGWSRLGWEVIAGVAWDTAGGRMVVTHAAGGARPPVSVPVRGCGPLLELAQERITHTRLGSWTVMLDGQRRLLAEARLRPATGELLWLVSCRDGLDLSDRQVRGQVARAVTQLRDELGIPCRSGAGLDRVAQGVRPGAAPPSAAG